MELFCSDPGNAPRTFARPELVRSRLKSHALLSLSSNTGLLLTYLHMAVECKSFLIWYHALELFSSCEISFQAIGNIVEWSERLKRHGSG